MARVQDKWDQREDHVVQREMNVICSTKFLDALIRHHGESKIEKETKPCPKTEHVSEPVHIVFEQPQPCNFPTLHKVEVIKRAVCQRFDIPIKHLESATRKAKVVFPRQIAMYLVRQHTTHSYAEIGRRLGGRDHTTILHAFRKITEMREKNAAIAAELESLEASIFA